MRLLVTRRMTRAAEETISGAFDATFRDSTTPLTEAEAIAALRENDAIIPTLGDPFSATVLGTSDRRARVLANFGAGFNHIDLQAARGRRRSEQAASEAGALLVGPVDERQRNRRHRPGAAA